jgi:hypothetical protein
MTSAGGRVAFTSSRLVFAAATTRIGLCLTVTVMPAPHTGTLR